MPKWGVNSKKEEARENEKTKKTEKKVKENKEKEDKQWEETDKQALKKLTKQKEEEQKQAEKLKKEQEKKMLYEKEQEELAKIKKDKNSEGVKNSKKVVMEIEDQGEEKIQTKQPKLPKNEESEDDIDDQINKEYGHLYKHQKAKHEYKDNEKVADNLDDALEALKVSDKPDEMHPEKRIKKAWTVFQEQNISHYRKEYPSLKKQQVLNIMWAEFKESNQNPMNSTNNVEWTKGKPKKE